MRKLFLSVLLAGVAFCGAKAQEVQGSKQNIDAVDKAVKSGHFEIAKRNEAKGITEHINVNYAISLAPFSQTLKLELSTPDPRLFTADVVDGSGKSVQHWQPQTKSHRYNETIDIHSLPAGSYKLDIYTEGNERAVHSISFRK